MKILRIIASLSGEVARAKAERDEAIYSKNAIINELLLTVQENRRLKELARIKQQKIFELSNEIKLLRREQDRFNTVR